MIGLASLLHRPKDWLYCDKAKGQYEISVIIGSTRKGRFSEKPAQWILQQLPKREGLEGRLLDLRDFPSLSSIRPCRPPCQAARLTNVVKNWTAQIAASDGFVFVTPEYNYGPSAVLKNAIDWVYPEWNRKAAAFVSYGSAIARARRPAASRDGHRASDGAGSIVRSHSRCDALGAFPGGDVDKGLTELEKQANVMIDDLLWWTGALKAARER